MAVKSAFPFQVSKCVCVLFRECVISTNAAADHANEFLIQFDHFSLGNNTQREVSLIKYVISATKLKKGKPPLFERTRAIQHPSTGTLIKENSNSEKE